MTQDLTGIVFEIETDQGAPGGEVAMSTAPGASPSSLSKKSGLLSPSDFSGTPRVASVVFGTPFSDTNYVVLLSGVDARIFTYFSKTTTGFSVSTNANGALSGEVSWLAMGVGES